MGDLWMPAPASSYAAELDRINILVHWLMLVLFVGWGAFFLFVLYRFRASRNPKANYAGVKSHASTWLEGAVAVAEAILLIGFSIPIWARRVEAIPTDKDAVIVRVVGEQFAWNIHYPGPDGVFGKTDVAKIDAANNPLGIDRSDSAAKDDFFTVNQLHLPVNKPAIIHLMSKDVIHSFNIPHMRVKQDAIPGMSIPVWFVPTKTSEEMKQITGIADFTYEIACAQLCGLGHYRMRGFVTVETAEQYAAWLAEQAPKEGEGDEFWQ